MSSLNHVIVKVAVLAVFCLQCEPAFAVERNFCNRTDRHPPPGDSEQVFTDLEIILTKDAQSVTPNPANGWTLNGSKKKWTYEGSDLNPPGCIGPINITYPAGKKANVKEFKWTGLVGGDPHSVKACCKTFRLYHAYRDGVVPATDFHIEFEGNLISAFLDHDQYGGDPNLEIDADFHNIHVTAFNTGPVRIGGSIELQVCYAGDDIHCPPEMLLAYFTTPDDNEWPVISRVVYNDSPTRRCSTVTFTFTAAVDDVYPNPPLPFTSVSGLGTPSVVFSYPPTYLLPGDGVGDDDGYVNFYSSDTTTEFEFVSEVWECEGIPTLSEWGLIIFALLVLSLITVLVTRRQAIMAGGGGECSTTMSRPLFVAAAYGKALVVTMALAAIGLVIALASYGTIAMHDVVGTLVCAAIVAYVAHLWISRNTEA